jgi:prepilin-type N-terminal cleavage/methylation domain-containing protein
MLFKEFGYSLIEMMVVVGIMGIMLVTGVASYNRLNDRAKVEQAAQLLATELRVIQKKADSGIHTCGGTDSFRGMRVQRIDNSTIRYCQQCGTVPTSCTDANLNISLASGSGVTISIFEAFDFLSVGRGVSIERTITVTNSIHTFLIDISRSGGIRVRKV